ncbi:TetR/AcrR family transcriptional regulator [Paracoccus sp. (in: a-proteobacteria)]|uniref:TetR/AcrR family transcriptional regulator n=1 Tax=Paracoccus sp. TaxID=267 RepID=UPI003A87C471
MAKDARRTGWKQDPEAVKADILRIAVQHFATHGLAGARVDEIARQTATSKRMIYYYFKDKEGLYQAALESEYERVRAGEWELELEGLDPVQAMTRLIEYTFDFHRENPNFVRMIAIENIHNGTFLERSARIRALNLRAVEKVDEIYGAGVRAGAFRAGLEPLELHWTMSAMSFYNVSNRITFSVGFGPELFSDSGQLGLRDSVTNTILRAILSPMALREYNAA